MEDKNKTKEDSSAESEFLISGILSSVQDGVSILDADMNIVRVNHAMEKWYSHAMPLTGKKCYHAYHGRDKRCDTCPTYKTLQTGLPAYEVVPLTGKGGEITGWLDLYSYPFIDRATGKIKWVIEYVRDITGRRRAEEALKTSEAQYEHIIQSVPDIIYEIDTEGNFTFVNDAVEQIGYKPGQLIGVNFKDILYPLDCEFVSREIVLPKYKGKITGSHQAPKLFDERRTGDRITKNLRVRLIVKGSAGPSDDTKLYEVSSWGKWNKDITFRDKEFIGSVGIMRDITENKIFQDTLEYRLEFERIITTLSTHFVNLTLDRIGQAIMHALQAIGEFLEVERSYLLLFNYDAGIKIDEVFEWCVYGIQPQADKLKSFPVDKLPWFLEKIRKGEAVCALSLEDLPAQAQAEKDEFKNRGVSSFLSVPLVCATDVIGVLGIDFNREAQVSMQDMLVLLKIAAEILSGALDHKRREENLRSSESRFRELASLLPETIFEADMDGNVTFINQNALSLFGYAQEDFRGGFNIFQVFALNERARAKENMHATCVGACGGLNEYTGLKKDGSNFKMLVRSSVITHGDKISGVRGFVLDITEIKKAEEALAAEKELLSVTLKSLEESVITADISGRIILINRAARILLGKPAEEIEGAFLNDIVRLSHENNTGLKENIVKLILASGRAESSATDKIILHTFDGLERVVSYTGVPIKDRESRVVGVVLVMRDITNRLKMEEEILKAQKIESVGMLAGGIAHDFNNILTAILNNITLAKMVMPEDSEAYGDLAEAEKASFRAKNLTQQLLTFSKGGVPVKKTASIAEILRDSAGFALRGSNVKCVFSFAADVLPVEADIGQLNQVVNNLLINAQEAMPGGGIVNIGVQNVLVSSRGDLPLEAGRYVKITVKDSGIGIPKEYLSKIFDPYFTTKKKGSGLGLSIVYSIMKRHGGHITVDSRMGEGTSFSLYLPASEKDLPPTEQQEAKMSLGEGKILFMDDEEMICQAMGRVLKKLGYVVEFACDGAKAIELYKKAKDSGAPFNAVIMDLTIPGGMGGKEAVKELLKYDAGARAIVTSGYSTDPIMAEFKDHGFKGVIVKPFRIEELAEVLHKVISGGI